MVWVSLIPLYSASTDWCDLVKDVGTPYIVLLDVVEPLVALWNEVVDRLNVTNFIVLSPVGSELQLGNLRIGVPSVSIKPNDERHVSTPFPVMS